MDLEMCRISSLEPSGCRVILRLVAVAEPRLCGLNGLVECLRLCLLRWRRSWLWMRLRHARWRLKRLGFAFTCMHSILAKSSQLDRAECNGLTHMRRRRYPWDFSTAQNRKLARDMFIRLEPTWLIGSPHRSAVSRLNTNPHFARMPRALADAKIKEGGGMHLRFALSLYRLQPQGGPSLLA